MKTMIADVFWSDSESSGEADRAPGVPFLGFISGTLVSLGLWALISWVAFTWLA
jgi:hypothetical protein